MEDKQLKNILVFFGMTGSGKSYLSTAWAEKHNCRRVNTDVVRKEYIAREKGGDSAARGIERGIYTAEYSRRTYEQVLAFAEEAVNDPFTPCVVLDGSYQRASERGRVTERFRGGASVFFIFCRCSEIVTRARLALRRKDGTAVSDGDYEVYLYQLRKFEKPAEIPPSQLLELDTDAPLEYLIGQLECFLAQVGAGLCRGGMAGGTR